jgi:sugar phosphate permease
MRWKRGSSAAYLAAGAVLFLLYIVAYLDRINVGFAALQMQQQLAFSDAVFGLGLGISFAGYFCFQLPSNLALQRVGARRWIALLMMVWGAISAAMILSAGRAVFILCDFCWVRRRQDFSRASSFI